MSNTNDSKSQMRAAQIALTVSCLLLVQVVAATADTYDLSWFTIDGGGATFSTGGTYQLGGTIGQPDAGSAAAPLIGGTYSLVGGFWPAANTCACPGDMNADGHRDGLDVQQFAACLIGGGNCSCADVDGANGVSVADVAVFVSDLLSGTGCP